MCGRPRRRIESRRSGFAILLVATSIMLRIRSATVALSRCSTRLLSTSAPAADAPTLDFGVKQDQVGKVEQIPQEHLSRLLVEGLHRVKAPSVYSGAGSQYQLIRDCHAQVVSTMESLLASEEGSSDVRQAKGVYIYGHRNAGKSALLNRVALWARTQPLVLLNFPKMRNLVTSPDGYIQPASKEWDTCEYLHSTLGTRMILDAFKFGGNYDMLKDVEVQFSDSKDVMKEHELLQDLPLETLGDFKAAAAAMLQASKKETVGCLLWDAFAKELSQNASVPVVALIDEFNTIFHQTHYYSRTEKPLEGTRLTPFISLLDSFVSGEGRRTYAVVAESAAFENFGDVKVHGRVPQLEKVMVPDVSKEEVNTFLAYAEAHELLQKTPTAQDKEMLHVTSNGGFYNVMKNSLVHVY